MGCWVGFPSPSGAAHDAIFRSHPFCASNNRTRRSGSLFLTIRAKISDGGAEEDPLLQAAITRASLRFQETHRPQPLFVDPYAGCFLPSTINQLVMNPHLDQYCVATKFIDDKLLSHTNNMDGLKQVVLLTDGMDTRPYRLNWPRSTIIFDLSPERIFQRAAKTLEDVGARIPKSCLFHHVPIESTDVQQTLRRKGFSGDRPSIWALQGLPVMTLASFKEILVMVGCLTMKGCLLVGELPAWLAETEIGIKSNTWRWMEKLFMSDGFKVDVIEYDKVAKNLGQKPISEDYSNLMFVAEHMRFSDDQMEMWRREFQRVEEEADEEGFEEL